ncbi:MAG: radical SAM protein [Desulfobulbaceae bacterium]|nr:radical SAM protein [Desulfobulbaceae bacterium]
MKYLFGPVNSRRLGLSLGIDLIPDKTCNFNCIYCEVGPNVHFTCERKEYSPTDDIISEIDFFLENENKSKSIDVFTITASGEPTLHSGLGQVISHIKDKSSLPVAVLTNGSLLFQKDVRLELQQADIVIPSLDAALEKSFRRINRPAPCVKFSDIIDGLCLFSQEFSGRLWLEILIAKNINDSDEDIQTLKKILPRINANRIQLNTVARPPLESFAAPATADELQAIAQRLPGKVEIIADFSKRQRGVAGSAERTKIIEILQRRPCTTSDICEALDLDGESTAQLLEDMQETGEIVHMVHQGKKYYQTAHTSQTAIPPLQSAK